MDEENPLRSRRAARAPACNLWAPIIPLPDAVVVDGQDANTATLGDAPADSEDFLLDDPEGIEARLATAI
jgi:hypothetical protein